MTSARRGGSTSPRYRRAASSAGSTGTPGKGRATPVRDGRQTKVSAPNRLARFLREVVAELRKVIWPTRNQMVTYTIVVLVFVSFMVALVAGLDFVFGQAIGAVFGP